jgi:ketosteroid isomerase-like protein
MKLLVFRTFALGLAPLLLLVGSAAAASAQAREPTDPLAVVERFYAALNAEDQAAALDLVADDVYVPNNKTCPPGQVCRGKAPVELDINQGIQAHARYTLVAPRVTGTTVTANVERRSPNIRAPGVERLLAKLTVEIRDGKIATYQNVDDDTDPQTAAFYAFQRSQAAAGQLPRAQLPPGLRPSALPNTGEAPPWPAWLAAAGLLSLVVGVGLKGLVRSRA